MTEGELWIASYTPFGYSDPQIRQFCLFRFPESENLHSSEIKLLAGYTLSFLNSWWQWCVNCFLFVLWYSVISVLFFTSVENFSIPFVKNPIQYYDSHLPLPLQYATIVGDYHQIAALLEIASLRWFSVSIYSHMSMRSSRLIVFAPMPYFWLSKRYSVAPSVKSLSTGVVACHLGTILCTEHVQYRNTHLLMHFCLCLVSLVLK